METQSNATFSRIYQTDDVPAGGLSTRIEATKEERLAIAAHLDLQDVHFLRVVCEVKSAASGAYDVRGSITARVVQTCIITLEAVAVEVDNPLNVRYMADAKPAGDDDEEFDPGAPDIESLVDGAMDLGQLAYEHLAIALDPYPRQAGTTFQWQSSDGPVDSDDDNPFAVLKGLKDG